MNRNVITTDVFHIALECAVELGITPEKWIETFYKKCSQYDVHLAQPSVYVDKVSYCTESCASNENNPKQSHNPNSIVYHDHNYSYAGGDVPAHSSVANTHNNDQKTDNGVDVPSESSYDLQSLENTENDGQRTVVDVHVPLESSYMCDLQSVENTQNIVQRTDNGADVPTNSSYDLQIVENTQNDVPIIDNCVDVPTNSSCDLQNCRKDGKNIGSREDLSPSLPTYDQINKAVLDLLSCYILNCSDPDVIQTAPRCRDVYCCTLETVPGYENATGKLDKEDLAGKRLLYNNFDNTPVSVNQTEDTLIDGLANDFRDCLSFTKTPHDEKGAIADVPEKRQQCKRFERILNDDQTTDGDVQFNSSPLTANDEQSTDVSLNRLPLTTNDKQSTDVSLNRLPLTTNDKQSTDVSLNRLPLTANDEQSTDVSLNSSPLTANDEQSTDVSLNSSPLTANDEQSTDVSLNSPPLTANDEQSTNVPLKSSTLTANDEQSTNVQLNSSTLTANDEQSTNVPLNSPTLTANDEQSTNVPLNSSTLTANDEQSTNVPLNSSTLTANDEQSTDVSLNSSPLTANDEQSTNVPLNSSTLTANDEQSTDVSLNSSPLTTNDEQSTNVSLNSSPLTTNDEQSTNVPLNSSPLTANDEQSTNVPLSRSPLTANNEQSTDVPLNRSPLTANDEQSTDVPLNSSTLTANDEQSTNVQLNSSPLTANDEQSTNVPLNSSPLTTNHEQSTNVPLNRSPLTANDEQSTDVLLNSSPLTANDEQSTNVPLNRSPLTANNEQSTDVPLNRSPLTTNDEQSSDQKGLIADNSSNSALNALITKRLRNTARKSCGRIQPLKKNSVNMQNGNSLAVNFTKSIKVLITPLELNPHLNKKYSINQRKRKLYTDNSLDGNNKRTKVDSLTHVKSGYRKKVLEPYVCETCNRRFRRSQALKSHQQTTFHSNKPHKSRHRSRYSCPLCKTSFSKVRNYKLHLKKHKEFWHATECPDISRDSRKFIKCPCCKAKFRKVIHYKKHFEKYRILREQCQVKLDNWDKATSAVNGLFVCVICNAKMKSRKKFKYHAMKHKGKKSSQTFNDNDSEKDGFNSISEVNGSSLADQSVHKVPSQSKSEQDMEVATSLSNVGQNMENAVDKEETQSSFDVITGNDPVDVVPGRDGIGVQTECSLVYAVSVESAESVSVKFVSESDLLVATSDRVQRHDMPESLLMDGISESVKVDDIQKTYPGDTALESDPSKGNPLDVNPGRVSLEDTAESGPGDVTQKSVPLNVIPEFSPVDVIPESVPDDVTHKSVPVDVIPESGPAGVIQESGPVNVMPESVPVDVIQKCGPLGVIPESGPADVTQGSASDEMLSRSSDCTESMVELLSQKGKDVRYSTEDFENVIQDTKQRRRNYKRKCTICEKGFVYYACYKRHMLWHCSSGNADIPYNKPEPREQSLSLNSDEITSTSIHTDMQEGPLGDNSLRILNDENLSNKDAAKNVQEEDLVCDENPPINETYHTPFTPWKNTQRNLNQEKIDRRLSYERSDQFTSKGEELINIPSCKSQAFGVGNEISAFDTSPKSGGKYTLLTIKDGNVFVSDQLKTKERRDLDLIHERVQNKQATPEVVHAADRSLDKVTEQNYSQNSAVQPRGEDMNASVDEMRHCNANATTLEVQSSVAPMHCSICSRNFKKKEAFTLHKRHHRDLDRFIENEGPKKNISALRAERIPGAGFRCFVCNCVIYGKRKFHNHLIPHKNLLKVILAHHKKHDTIESNQNTISCASQDNTAKKQVTTNDPCLPSEVTSMDCSTKEQTTTLAVNDRSVIEDHASNISVEQSTLNVYTPETNLLASVPVDVIPATRHVDAIAEVVPEDVLSDTSQKVPNRTNTQKSVRNSTMSQGSKYEVKYSCNQCKREFVYHGAYTRHVQMHSYKKIFSNVESPLVRVTPRSVHVDDAQKSIENSTSSQGSKTRVKYTCSVCNKQFVYHGMYVRHLQMHSYKQLFRNVETGPVDATPQGAPEDATPQGAPEDVTPEDAPEDGSQNPPKKTANSTSAQKSIVLENSTTSEGSNAGLKYTCSECNKEFVRHGMYKRHLKVHSNVRNVPENTIPEGAPDDAIPEGGPMDGSQDPPQKAPDSTSAKKSIENSATSEDSNAVVKYTCSHCSKGFVRHGMYMRHLKIHSNLENGIEDTTTEGGVDHGLPDPLQKTPDSTSAHKSIEKSTSSQGSNTGIKYTCSQCDKGFVRHGMYLRHLKIHSNVQNGTEDTTTEGGVDHGLPDSGSTNAQTSIENSISSQGPKDGVQYSCSVCNKEFVRHAMYKRHLEIHSNAENGPEDSIPEGASEDAISEGASEDDTTEGGAEDGSQDQPQKAADSTSAHKSIEHSATSEDSNTGVKYTCSQCDKVFIRRGMYMRHLKIHAYKQIYSKNKEKKSVKKAQPSGHEQNQMLFNTTLFSSTKELPTIEAQSSYQCNECSREFSNTQILQEHIINIHKPYKCHQCGQNNNSSIELTTHLKIEHANQIVKPKIQCTICHKNLFTAKELIIHYRSHKKKKRLGTPLDKRRESLGSLPEQHQTALLPNEQSAMESNKSDQLCTRKRLGSLPEQHQTALLPNEQSTMESTKSDQLCTRESLGSLPEQPQSVTALLPNDHSALESTKSDQLCTRKRLASSINDSSPVGMDSASQSNTTFKETERESQPDGDIGNHLIRKKLKLHLWPCSECDKAFTSKQECVMHAVRRHSREQPSNHCTSTENRIS